MSNVDCMDDVGRDGASLGESLTENDEISKRLAVPDFLAFV